MNSKLDLRIEAARIAANVEGVNAENLIDVCEKVASFLEGSAELPEVYDPNENMKAITAALAERWKPEVDDAKNAYGTVGETGEA